LLVWAEQGVGDEIMFGTMLGEVRERCERLLVQADRRLLPLLRRSFGEGVDFYPRGEVVAESLYDEQVAMGSLGRFLRRSRESFAGRGGAYLKVDEGRRDRYRRELGGDRGEVLCGLSWRSANPETGAARSLELRELVGALRRPGVRFVNLQYGDVSEELEAVERELGERVLQCGEVDNREDLDGLASLMGACDVVVSVGNATAHLCGAIGQRGWVLLPYVAGWRWMTEGERSLWYDSLQLCRQPAIGSWTGLLDVLGGAFSAKFLRSVRGT
jgi:hypothetical protein